MSSDATQSTPSSQTRRDYRRRFLRLFGTAAAVLPITVLSGCSDEQASAPADQPDASSPPPPPQQTEQAATAADDAPAETVESAAAETEQAAEQVASTAQQASGELQQLSLDDPSAQALGYRHDAANVDLQKYPQRAKDEAANHYCRNCALFQGGDGEEWGPCALFPGKLVNANGWCSGYAPRQA